MRCIDLDSKHSRAIVHEIGKSLRAVLKEEPECPVSLRTQIDRLRELESHHQSFQRLSVGTRVAVEPHWTAQMVRPNMDEQCHR
jgi:hypothetical protein